MTKRINSGCLLGALLAAGVAIVGGTVWRRWQRLPVAAGRVELLDVPIDAITMQEALARIEEFVRSGQPHHVFTADATGIMRAHDDPELLAIVQQADLSTPDGAGVLTACRLHDIRLPERVSGCDMVELVSAMAAEHGFRVYFFGAAEGIARDAAEALAQRHPGLIVAGIRHGFFTAGEEPAVVAEIAAARPDILFVALGIPKQELFIRCHFAELAAPVMIGVGGSFDVISGHLQRAPRWMQRTGLEWLFRLLQEPSRFPRMAVLPRFIATACRKK